MKARSSRPNESWWFPPRTSRFLRALDPGQHDACLTRLAQDHVEPAHPPHGQHVRHVVADEDQVHRQQQVLGVMDVRHREQGQMADPDRVPGQAVVSENGQMTKTLNPLHFEDLEPHRFEDLVRQIIYDFKEWSLLEPTDV